MATRRHQKVKEEVLRKEILFEAHRCPECNAVYEYLLPFEPLFDVAVIAALLNTSPAQIYHVLKQIGDDIFWYRRNTSACRGSRRYTRQVSSSQARRIREYMIYVKRGQHDHITNLYDYRQAHQEEIEREKTTCQCRPIETGHSEASGN